MRSTKICCLAVVATALFISACSSEAPVERSFQDDLELRLGRELTPTEVVEYKDAAELLCSADESILEQLWTDLDAEQFAFQTFVFTEECPEREALYRQARVEQRNSQTTTTQRPTSTSGPTTTN